MRSLVSLTAAGLWLASLAGPAGVRAAELGGAVPGVGPAPQVQPLPPEKAIPAEKPKKGCRDHGTAVHFMDTPSEAAQVALKEEKLVFVLHVSGLFDDPRLT